MDFNNPVLSSLYQDVLSDLKTRDEHIMKQEFTSDTNIPTGTIRKNPTTKKPEEWNGSAWVQLTWSSDLDTHVADTTIHFVMPPGVIFPYGGASAPSGYLLCDGSAVNRTTYAALFAILSTKYGVGDGSTTFNLPDLRGRLPIGLTSGTAALNDRGKTAGSWDHTHSTPTHQHTTPTHTHTMGNHTHTAPSHTHTVPNHTHDVPGHSHDSRAPGATINIGSSGSHQHDIPRRSTAGSTSGTTRVSMPGSSGTDDSGGATVNNSTPNHTHANSAFGGTVGNNTTGYNGDYTFSTLSSGASTTSSDGGSATSAPSTNTTDGSGTLTTNAGEGGGTSGVGNPPVQVVNFIIKT